jgi:hypothetical protein
MVIHIFGHVKYKVIQEYKFFLILEDSLVKSLNRHCILRDKERIWLFKKEYLIVDLNDNEQWEKDDNVYDSERGSLTSHISFVIRLYSC